MTRNSLRNTRVKADLIMKLTKLSKSLDGAAMPRETIITEKPKYYTYGVPNDSNPKIILPP